MAMRSTHDVSNDSQRGGECHELTLLAAGQLRTLAANLGVEAVGQGLDELQDVRVTARLPDLLIRDL